MRQGRQPLPPGMLLNTPTCAPRCVQTTVAGLQLAFLDGTYNQQHFSKNPDEQGAICRCSQ